MVYSRSGRLGSAIDGTITAKKQADLTIKALAKIAEIQGIVSKGSTSAKFEEAMKVAISNSQKQVLLADTRIFSQSIANIDPEYAEIWVDSTVAYLTVLATGNPKDAYATLVQQSLGIVNNLWASNSLNNKVERINEYILALNALRELLEEGRNLYTLTPEFLNDLLKKQAEKEGWHDYIFSEDYELERARKQLFTLIGMIEYYEKEVDFKLVREGEDIIIFNAGKKSLYKVGLVDFKCNLNNSFSIAELKVGEYKKLKNSRYIDKKGCKTELSYHLSKPLTEGYQYRSTITKNDLQSLAPINSPYNQDICPDSKKNKALQTVIAYQKENIKRSQVGIRYFSADACDSIHHDNDPFKPSDKEQVHNLIDLPSHFLYSLEDYQWDNTEKRLKQRTTTFFGDANVADNREPLLIIHGWQGGKDEDTPEEWFNNADSGEIYWEDFIKYMQTPVHREFFAKNYKPYIYHYPSFKHITYNGRKLKELIATMPELAGKKITIVAHSMGGLISRSWIEEHGGETQLNKLITLATPHHGSPAAVSAWVDSASWLKSLYTLGALDMMWDNYDGILEKEKNDLGNNWLNQREKPFGLGITNGTQLSAFDRYYLAKITKIGSASNPWLSHLNQTKQTVQNHYYRYASYAKIGDNIINDHTLNFSAFLLDIIASQYETDGVVPDSSGFNSTTVFSKKETVYPKPKNGFFTKLENKDRFIWDMDHDLFRQGLHGRFFVDLLTIGNQQKFIKALLNTDTLPDWGEINNENVYDPLWLMVKQDLGYNEDSDSDGMPNQWEIDHGFNPNDPSDANKNADNDHLTNKQEYEAGTDPRKAEILLSVNHRTQNAVISWTPMDGNNTYTVYMAKEPFTYQDILNDSFKGKKNAVVFDAGTQPAAQVTPTADELAQGVNVYLLLKVENSDTNKTRSISNIMKISFNAASLAAPKNLKAIAGDKQITLTWDSVTDADKYTVYRAEESGITPENYSIYQGGVMLENKTSPLVVTGLKNGSMYYFVVTASKGTLQSKASNKVSATPKKIVIPTKGKLNDTGITRCADNSSNDLDCPVAGYPGQDAEYGTNTMSFTKIGANGEELPDSATQWYCVKDNNTGLIWEVKQDKNDQKGDSLHDADDRYNWYNTDTTNNGGHKGLANYSGDICFGYNNADSSSYCNTQAYVKRVNTATWCGANDWRMPTREELRSIVSYDRTDPAIDTAYFPNTVSGLFWSSSSYALYSGSVWVLYFDGGYNGYGIKGDNVQVRLVRSGQ